MHPHKKFAFDVGITFIASAVTLLGFVITVVLGRYLGAGDLGAGGKYKCHTKNSLRMLG